MGKGRILEITAKGIDRRDRIEIAVEPKNVQNGGIRSDRDAHAAVLDVPQRHHGHTCPLCDEFCREPAAEPSCADSFTETRKPAFHRREQRSYSLGHAIILALTRIKSYNNGISQESGCPRPGLGHDGHDN
jgi:hypothetical protein